MCDFFPLCFVWGCPTKIDVEGGGPAMICPRCHNPSVQGAKSRMWFEFCFVPLIPCSSDQIWYCPICSWEAPQAGNPQPQLAQAGYMGPAPPQFTQPGYQPPPQAWGAPPGPGSPYGVPQQQGGYAPPPGQAPGKGYGQGYGN